MAEGPDSRAENTLGGRVRRYAQVSGTMGGLAARLAGARFLGISIDRASHAEELRAALGGLKGPLMKVAQLLATIPEALPKEYAAELAQLQSQAPPMGRPFVRRRMAAELGPGWRDRFADFELDAAAAASLGQVHRATALDGRRLACKLQYPSIESAVEADLAQLRLVFGIYRRYDGSINPEQIYDELAERLREELDYRREARHMALYRQMLRDETGVRVPDVLPELSSGRLLTMTWLDGRPLLELVGAPQEERNRLAYNMFRAWYVPFYDYAVIHGDPHLGNYTARPDLTINLIDFGCIRVFRPTLVQGVIDLYWALVRGDMDLAVHAYETWGFADLRKEVIDTLNLWAAFVYAPLMEDRPRLIEETNSGAQGRTVAFNVQRRLREIGGVTPPREFVLMDRAAIGLGSVFMHLQAEVNWHQLFPGFAARSPGPHGPGEAGPVAGDRRSVAPLGPPPTGFRSARDGGVVADLGGLLERRQLEGDQALGAGDGRRAGRAPPARRRSARCRSPPRGPDAPAVRTSRPSPGRCRRSPSRPRKSRSPSWRPHRRRRSRTTSSCSAGTRPSAASSSAFRTSEPLKVLCSLRVRQQ
ncbi:MAG: hypothetical protein K0S35_3293 [Geminicoccaceae bacterium]|nr:hypothetical protein [Geminicoccaceae bacterium]